MHRLLPALALTLLAAPLPAQEVVTEISLDRMHEIVRGMGFDVAVESADDKILRFEVAGHTVLLFLLNDDTDGQLWAGFVRDDVGVDKMNAWNREYRFTRAYLDDEDDPILESDLDFEGGVTVGAVEAWIRLYRDLLVRFGAFIDE